MTISGNLPDPPPPGKSGRLQTGSPRTRGLGALGQRRLRQASLGVGFRYGFVTRSGSKAAAEMMPTSTEVWSENCLAVPQRALYRRNLGSGLSRSLCRRCSSVRSLVSGPAIGSKPRQKRPTLRQHWPQKRPVGPKHVRVGGSHLESGRNNPISCYGC